MTQKLYVIHSLKWSGHPNYGETVYWGPNNNGYTADINQAGIYTEEQVNAKRDYYDNGDSTKAVLLEAEKRDLDSLLAHLNIKEAAHNDFSEFVKKKELDLVAYKQTLKTNEEELKQLRFEVNQQLVLHGKEPAK